MIYEQRLLPRAMTFASRRICPPLSPRERSGDVNLFASFDTITGIPSWGRLILGSRAPSFHYLPCSLGLYGS